MTPTPPLPYLSPRLWCVQLLVFFVLLNLLLQCAATGTFEVDRQRPSEVAAVTGGSNGKSLVRRQDGSWGGDDPNYVEPSWVEESDTGTYAATDTSYATDSSSNAEASATDSTGQSTATDSAGTSSQYDASSSASPTEPSSSFVYDSAYTSQPSSSTDSSSVASSETSTQLAITSTPPSSTTDTPTSTLPASSTDTGSSSSAASFSVTSSTATPSLVLGSNECSGDAKAVNGECPNDYFCNAATAACVQLLGDGQQCYEDFQCQSSHCINNTCGQEQDKSSDGLSGGAIAGIAVGLVAGAACLLFAFLCVRRRRVGQQVSRRARKFEQIQNDDARDMEEQTNYMFNTGNNVVGSSHDLDDTRRASKYNLLASVLGGSALGRSLSRMGNGGVHRPVATERELADSPSVQYGNMAPALAGAALAAPSPVHENEKTEAQPDTTPTQQDAHMQQPYEQPYYAPSAERQSYGDHQYYGDLNLDAPMPAQQHNKASWASSQFAFDPAMQASSPVDRPLTMRDSTFTNLHAPIFKISGPESDQVQLPQPPPSAAVAAPLAAAAASNAQEGEGETKRGSWLLKEIAARWQQGSSSGARASGITQSSDVPTTHNGEEEDPSAAAREAARRSSLMIPANGHHLWDDALAASSTGGDTTLERSSSMGTQNPFRYSAAFTNPRDSLNSGPTHTISEQDTMDEPPRTMSTLPNNPNEEPHLARENDSDPHEDPQPTSISHGVEPASPSHEHVRQPDSEEAQQGPQHESAAHSDNEAHRGEQHDERGEGEEPHAPQRPEEKNKPYTFI